MSLVSRTAQYALRAMTLLAAQEERMTVKDLALAVGAPQPYLARIIMALADTGMVDARRGPGGGLCLGREPTDITLMEIVCCFDGNTLFEECALGLPGCSNSSHKCPVHGNWGGGFANKSATGGRTPRSPISSPTIPRCAWPSGFRRRQKNTDVTAGSEGAGTNVRSAFFKVQACEKKLNQHRMRRERPHHHRVF